MTKYIRVETAPTELANDEVVIKLPDFMPEVLASKFQRGNRKETTPNMLRTTLIEIAQKYDPTFEVYREFNASLYDGLSFEADDKLYSALIFDIIDAIRPEIIDNALVESIKSATKDGKVNKIYFVNPDMRHTKPFSLLKIDHEDIPGLTKTPNSRYRKKYNTDNQENANTQLNKE